MKAYNDAKTLGIELLDASTRAQYEAEIKTRPPYPNIVERAKLADEYWIGKGAVSDRSSFRGLYGAIYRQFSIVVHAGVDSVCRLIEPGPTRDMKMIGRAEAPGALNVFTAASILFTACLLISSKVVGFPDSDDLHAIISKQ